MSAAVLSSLVLLSLAATAALPRQRLFGAHGELSLLELPGEAAVHQEPTSAHPRQQAPSSTDHFVSRFAHSIVDLARRREHDGDDGGASSSPTGASSSPSPLDGAPPGLSDDSGRQDAVRPADVAAVLPDLERRVPISHPLVGGKVIRCSGNTCSVVNPDTTHDEL
eukprot:CAMPEP_0119378184 /NCGR_PEP_ID=MMETSP1334-20130426/47456_1 /TAXON_ID=127549 /ORGANISM="Calcidiscus leptoporus, Strain RCC1130" /LENGTH=165 /DNA_ID=CAMNT_0007397309 /DNA_START=119 /DNA_END=616 /DNA_ORIENTATION=+